MRLPYDGIEKQCNVRIVPAEDSTSLVREHRGRVGSVMHRTTEGGVVVMFDNGSILLARPDEVVQVD